jgi:hypothetical protein
VASRERLDRRQRKARKGAPLVGKVYDAARPAEVPADLVLTPGAEMTLRGQLGKVLGHFNQLSEGAFFIAAADLLGSTSVNEGARGFPGGFFHANANPAARLLAVGGIWGLSRSLRGLLAPLFGVMLLPAKPQQSEPRPGARIYSLGQSLDAFLFIFQSAIVWNGATWMALAVLHQQLPGAPLFSNAFVWVGLLLAYIAVRQFFRLRSQEHTWLDVFPYPVRPTEKASAVLYHLGSHEIDSLSLKLVEYRSLKRWAPQGVIHEKLLMEDEELEPSAGQEPVAKSAFSLPRKSGKEQTRWGIALNLEIRHQRPVTAFFPLSVEQHTDTRTNTD